jgi:hypothetical protein
LNLNKEAESVDLPDYYGNLVKVGKSAKRKKSENVLYTEIIRDNIQIVGRLITQIGILGRKLSA